MKALPKVKQGEMRAGLFYVGAIRPMGGVNDGCADRDEMHFYGPVGGLQITHGHLRDPADGEFYGGYDQGQALWAIDQHDKDGNRRWLYSDLFLTWITPEGDEVEKLRAHCLALSRDLVRAEKAMQSMAGLLKQVRPGGGPMPAEAGEVSTSSGVNCWSDGTGAHANRGLAVVDALGDVLGCGQGCLCPDCRDGIQRAMALMLGIHTDQEAQDG